MDDALVRDLAALVRDLEAPDTHPDHQSGARAAAAMLRAVLERHGHGLDAHPYRTAPPPHRSR